MCGNYQYDLFADTFHETTIKVLKKAMRQFVFDDPGILKLELSAQSILSFLMKKFIKAFLYFECEGDNFSPSKTDEKYIKIFSENHINDYRAAKTDDESTNLYLRLLMVTDFISGMTDSYARNLYRELSGIE